MLSEDKEPLREQGCCVCTGPAVVLGRWVVHDRARLWVWKDPLAGEPFKLTVGSAVGAAPEHKHKRYQALLVAANACGSLPEHALDRLESLLLVVTFLNC